MSSNNTGPSPDPSPPFEENINPGTFDSDEGYSSESPTESEMYVNPTFFSYGVPVTTPLRGNNMASPPAVQRGRFTGLSNRNNNDPGDLASRMEEMSDDSDNWWTGDTPDKLGVTPLSVIKKNRGNPLFKKDYGAYTPADASNPVHRALIKPLNEATNIEELTEQLQFSLMYLEDYIRANNLEGITGKSVDEIRTEIGWPIQEVYDRLNNGWRGRAGGSPVVGGKRKSRRRLGKSRKGRNSRKSKKTRNTRKSGKSKKTRKTKKSGRKTR